MAPASKSYEAPNEHEDQPGLDVLGRFKVAKRFRLQITDDTFRYKRLTEAFAYSQ